MDFGGTAVIDDALDQLVVGVDHLVKVLEEGGLDSLDDTGFVNFMQALERVRNRIPLADHRIIADAERRNLPQALTQGNLVRTLMSTLRLSPGEASRRVRAAAAVGERTSMLGQPLPPVRAHLSAAQRTGDVNPEQVAIIERALSKVDHRGFDPADLVEGEELLTRFAETFGPKQLRILAEQVVDRIDPDGTLPNDHLNADRRHFHLRQTRDGAWTGEFRLTGSLGSKLQALLGPLSRPRIDVTEAGISPASLDVRTHGQRMHDALEDVCDRLLRSDRAVPDAGGTPATVVITVDIEDLMKKTGYAMASDGTLIRTEHALRLADQANLYFAALNAQGVVLKLGRARRIATLGQTAALIARDKGCSFPGCDAAPEWSERHHIRPWVDGGMTDVDNLTLLCRYHHHNFAARGWTCALNPDGLPEWRPPRSVDPQRRPLINSRITGALAARRYRSIRT
jgi:Domain of unknown function (DUF222)/HNH endonuclease